MYFLFTEVAADRCLSAKLGISVRCSVFTCYVSKLYFFLGIQARREGGAMGASAPLPPQAMEVHSTLRPIQVVGKQNSSIQFLSGHPHFLAHSSSFILRHWTHLSVLSLLPIVLELFLALFCFASTFFLRFIPKSIASMFSYFRLIICIILRLTAQSDFIYVVQSRILHSF